MGRPKTKTVEEIRARKTLYMARIRREAQGIPIDAPPYSSLCGEGAPMHKLTMEQVREARKMRAAGHTVRGLADLFGVASSTMGAIVTGKTYKEES